jgi:hypothetical protein
MTEEHPEFQPTEWIENPNLSLEDVRSDGDRCYGRGRSTAAVRGYDAEKLANAVLDERARFTPESWSPWYDTVALADEGVCNIESKSCVYRYPSGPYGRFRIWKKHHDTLTRFRLPERSPASVAYFFVVYTIERSREREVGKLLVPATRIDEVIDDWSFRDHPSMGECHARDISWHQLLKRLGVPQEVFVEQDIVDLTDGP